MTIDLYMFSPFMKNWIIDNMDSRLTITVKLNWFDAEDT